MPGLDQMPIEGMTIPKLSISIHRIIRFLVLTLDGVIIDIIGYYFAYYHGSYRYSIFHPELMMLICAVSAFINTSIMVRNTKILQKRLNHYYI